MRILEQPWRWRLNRPGQTVWHITSCRSMLQHQLDEHMSTGGSFGSLCCGCSQVRHLAPWSESSEHSGQIEVFFSVIHLHVLFFNFFNVFHASEPSAPEDPETNTRVSRVSRGSHFSFLFFFSKATFGTGAHFQPLQRHLRISIQTVWMVHHGEDVEHASHPSAPIGRRPGWSPNERNLFPLPSGFAADGASFGVRGRSFGSSRTLA